jgi:P-type E1-E2 ATPase
MKECLHCAQSFEASNAEDNFCCHGCEVVYHAFQANGLKDFYRYKDTKSDPVNLNELKSQFAFLEHKETKESFLRADGKLHISFYIEGIHCLACIWLFERLKTLNPHILDNELNFNSQVLKLKVDPQGDLSEIARLIQSFGYKIHLLEDMSKDEIKQDERKKYLARIAVAFFSMGNIMLMSASIYSGASEFFEKYFNLLSGLLSIPVIFYSCIPFFKNLYFSIKNMNFSIDVPISIALSIGYGASFYGIFYNPELVYFDSLTMLVFLLLGSRFILDEVKYNIEKKLSHYNFFSKILATRLNNGQEEEVLAKYIKKDDHLLIAAGSTVPTDCILESSQAYFDTSLINGESEVVHFRKGSQILAGMINKSGKIKALSIRNYADSFIGKLENELSNNTGLKNRYSKLALLSAKAFFYIAIILSLYILFTIRPWDVALERLIAIIIITCPCALGLVVPLTMIMGLKTLNAQGIYVKDESTILKLAELKNVFLDKTGTLTKKQIDYEFEYFTDDEESVFNLLLNLEKKSNHPIAKELLRQFPIRDEISLNDFSEEFGVLAANFQQTHLSIRPNRDFNYTCFDFFINDKLSLRVKVMMQMRTDAYDLIQGLKQRELNLFLLSGDNEGKVKEASRHLGVKDYFAAVKPFEKNEIISGYKHTLMIGDGVNDSLSLKNADVSIAVNTSVDFAQRCADIFLAKDNLSLVLALFNQGQRISRVLKRNILLSTVLNSLFIYFALIGYISPFMAAIIMPATSLFLLVHTLISLNTNVKVNLTKTDNYHVLKEGLKLT